MRYRPAPNLQRVGARGRAVAGIVGILALAGVLPMVLLMHRPATRTYPQQEMETIGREKLGTRDYPPLQSCYE